MNCSLGIKSFSYAIVFFHKLGQFLNSPLGLDRIPIDQSLVVKVSSTFCKNAQVCSLLGDQELYHFNLNLPD